MEINFIFKNVFYRSLFSQSPFRNSWIPIYKSYLILDPAGVILACLSDSVTFLTTFLYLKVDPRSSIDTFAEF